MSAVVRIVISHWTHFRNSGHFIEDGFLFTDLVTQLTVS